MDTAEILARKEVVNAIVDTIVKAMTDAGISQTATVRVGLGFRQRIEDGSTYPPALALVEEIRKLLDERDFIEPAPEEPNYAAAHRAFLDRIAYWAPELFRSPDHFAELFNTVVTAARSST